jgi:PHD/YefM family antitoxin component YafN of YafNO toxin-antitoxin module
VRITHPEADAMTATTDPGKGSTYATLTSREFNQNASAAKQAALNGPVFITDRGRPAHVLLCMEDYQRLIGAQANLVDLLAQDGAAHIEFEPSRAQGFTRAVEL